MASRGLSRRQFLRRAGGSAGIVAVGLGGTTALHHAHAQHAAPDETAELAMPGHGTTPRATAAQPAALAEQRDDAQYAFFNDEQADTIAAIAERLWPGAPGKPGAREADVLNYIDLALAGAYLDQQDFYRRGLQALDAYTADTLGQPFRRLAPEQQDDVLRAVERGAASGFTWPTAQAFFNTLWTHTIEGMFADPVYGGNRDFAGWRLIEFDGAQPRYLRGDMQTDAKFTRVPILGLKQQYEERPAGERVAPAGGE
jgi:gluconate 2-dehydrogenase gamma chain